MADLATIQQQLAAQYPEFAAAPADFQLKYLQAVTTGTPQQRMAALSALQKQYPQYIKNESIWKNKAFLIGLAALGGGLAYGALAPAAAASTAPDLAAALPGAEGGLAATASTVAPVVAASGGGSLLHSLLPSIIGAGSNIAGTAIASHANTEAAKIAAEEADKALAIQQQQYALQRQDTAPYRALGQGAVNNLGFLGGIDTTSNLEKLSSTVPTTLPPPLPIQSGAPGSAPTAGPPIAPPVGPTPAQQSSLNRLGPSGTLVRVQNPQTGLVHLIPQSQVAAAQADGGRVVA